MTNKAFYISLLFGQVLLAAGWFSAGYWQGGVLFICFALLHIYLFNKKYTPQLTGIFLFISVLLAGVGIWGKVDSFLMIGGAAFMLAAWDLDYFKNQLAGVPLEDHPAELERMHFMKLLFLEPSTTGVYLDKQAM